MASDEHASENAALPPIARHADAIEGGVSDGVIDGAYELELERWFRARFAWLCVAFVGLVTLEASLRVVSFLGDVAGGADLEAGLTGQFANVLGSAAVLIIALHFYLFVRPLIERREQAVAAATRLILTLGATTFVFQLAMLLLFGRMPIPPILSILFWHVMASAFLPWTPRESLRPILPLLCAWAVFTATRGAIRGEWWPTALTLVASPLVLVPGMLLAHFRLTRHRRRFRRELSNRFFVSMRRELQQARKIHESLFPKASQDAHFRFEYRYRPAQEVGGDFIHVWTDHHGIIHLTLLDVTGHGLVAAMTVNRLYGELERLRYEHPYLRPGSVLSLLNRYVLLTLAPHKIFATALMLRIDPRTGTMTYANGGHPPLFVRGRGGALREIDSTTALLGVLQPQDFGVDDVTLPLEQGDQILAYTDGVFEARDRRNRKWGLQRLRDALKRQPPPSSWPEYLLSLVDSFTNGVLDDDLLVASLTFTAKAQPTTSLPPVPDDETTVISL
jgi:serine phosphatase RsbU (regulator of sigma subunit)